MEIYQFNKKLFTYNGRPLYTGSIGGGGGSYPTDGLWALWRFDEDVLDSYSTNNLTNSPGSYETGSIPSSFNKSAASFSAFVPTITNDVFVSSTDGLSISLWIYPKSTGPTGYICGGNGNSYLRCAVGIRISSDTILWGKEKSGTFGMIGSTSFSLRDQWVHLVLTTSDGDTFKFYINNVKGTDASRSDDINYNIFNIGNITTGTEYLTNCKVASMFIYSKSLSDEEIGLLYNNGNGV